MDADKLVLAVSGALNLGLTEATIKYVAEEKRRKDTEAVIRVIQSTLWTYAFLSIAIAVLVQIFAPFLIETIFKVPVSESHIAVHSLRVAGWGFQVRMFYGVVESVCRGFERYDLESKAQSGIAVIGPVVSATLAYFGATLSEILIGGIVVLLIGGIVLAKVVSNLLGTTRWLGVNIQLATLKRTLGFGIYTWAQAISALLVQQADKLIVASAIGAEKLTYYTICIQVAQIAHGLIAKGSSFLFPKICVAKSEGNEKSLKELFWKGAFLTSCAGTLIALPLAIFSDLLLRFWLGDTAAKEVGFSLKILAFGNAMLSSSIIPSYFMNGAGFVRGNTVASMLSGISIVTSAVLLVPKYGLLGAAASRIANLPVSFVTRCLVAKYVLNHRRSLLGLVTLLPPVIGFLPYITAFLMRKNDSVAVMVSTSLLGALCAVACGPFFSRISKSSDI